jgi:hypothetical protein
MAASVVLPARWISAITARVVALALLACSVLAARAWAAVSTLPAVPSLRPPTGRGFGCSTGLPMVGRMVGRRNRPRTKTHANAAHQIPSSLPLPEKPGTEELCHRVPCRRLSMTRKWRASGQGSRAVRTFKARDVDGGLHIGGVAAHRGEHPEKKPSRKTGRRGLSAYCSLTLPLSRPKVSVSG